MPISLEYLNEFKKNVVKLENFQEVINKPDGPNVYKLLNILDDSKENLAHKYNVTDLDIANILTFLNMGNLKSLEEEIYKLLYEELTDFFDFKGTVGEFCPGEEMYNKILRFIIRKLSDDDFLSQGIVSKVIKTFQTKLIEWAESYFNWGKGCPNEKEIGALIRFMLENNSERKVLLEEIDKLMIENLFIPY